MPTIHNFLESKREFATLIKYRIDQYWFIENQDFTVYHKFMVNPEGGRPQKKYALTLEMPKELVMVEGNHKGKMVRHI